MRCQSVPSFQPEVSLQIDYARELNEQQLAAVTAPPGPSLVIAGAGSGKTRTLIYRVAYLLEQGIPPERILLLTFTNKAAGEMMRRVTDLLGTELKALWGGTFHSIANRILRKHATLLGFQPGFVVLDRDDANHLIKDCLAEIVPKSDQTSFPTANVLEETFSLAANTRRSFRQILSERHPDFEAHADKVADIQRAYAASKRNRNAMDFDDLLVFWLQLLEEHADVRQQYQTRFQFILVDEYQDTNKLQSDLIDLLAEPHHNLMVVGDDAQSIYAWRGANYENILKFDERYPETRIYKVEINYRSTPEILDAANAAIARNVKQHRKQLATERKSGVKPTIVVLTDAKQQAAFVAHRLVHLREEGTDLKRMAVLYRSHFHALELQLELKQRHIPFSITSGIRFFEQAHMKDVAAYLRLVLNPRDELAFRRLVQMLPGVGEKAARKLWKAFVEKLPESNPAGAPSVATLLQSCADEVPKKATTGWAQFVVTIAQLESDGVRNDAYKMINLVLEAGYEEYLEQNYSSAGSRLADLRKLADYAHQFSNAQELLTDLALMSNLDAEDEDSVRREDDDQVRLSTIHQAKGLEFDVVFIIMLCEGSFPTDRSLKEADGDEEERRLFYVALTRARNQVYLSYPLYRAGFGGQQPSRFLNEIPSRLVEQCSLVGY